MFKRALKPTNTSINPFSSNALFLFLLKTCFQGVGKVCIGNEWINWLTCRGVFRTVRSSHRKSSLKKVVLRNFTKFTGKQLCQKLFFNIVASLRPATLLTKRLWYRCFPVNFAKFLRTLFLQTPTVNTLRIACFYRIL